MDEDKISELETESDPETPKVGGRVVATVGGAGRGRPPLTISARHKKKKKNSARHNFFFFFLFFFFKCLALCFITEVQ